MMPRPAPVHFDEIFVSKGRFECEAFFHAPRIIIDAWLRERGKRRLLAERAESVRSKRGLTRTEMQTILETAFVPPQVVDPEVARRAAHFLRCVRNGGWIISPAPDGEWWVGAKRRPADELVEKAVRLGFDANLTGGVS